MGWSPQFSCQLRAIIGPCDHVVTGSLKAKMVCRIRTKTLGVKHGDGGDWLKISRRMELKAVLSHFSAIASHC